MPKAQCEKKREEAQSACEKKIEKNSDMQYASMELL